MKNSTREGITWAMAAIIAVILWALIAVVSIAVPVVIVVLVLQWMDVL